MRIVIAVILFALAVFAMIGDGHIHINTLTLLLALGGLSVLISHFQVRKK